VLTVFSAAAMMRALAGTYMPCYAGYGLTTVHSESRRRIVIPAACRRSGTRPLGKLRIPRPFGDCRTAAYISALSMQGRDLSTLAPLWALPARTPERTRSRRAVGDGVRSRPGAGCGVCCRCTRKGVCNEQLTVGISCAKDEGGPLGIGFQEQVPNQSKLLRSKGVVVSVGSKARTKFGQVSIRETSVSKPSVTRRKALDTAKTGGARILWDKSVGHLGTGQMAVGV